MEIHGICFRPQPPVTSPREYHCRDSHSRDRTPVVACFWLDGGKARMRGRLRTALPEMPSGTAAAEGEGNSISTGAMKR